MGLELESNAERPVYFSRGSLFLEALKKLSNGDVVKLKGKGEVEIKIAEPHRSRRLWLNPNSISTNNISQSNDKLAGNINKAT